MKILILGGTGYLGYHLLGHFIAHGHEAVCIVRECSNQQMVQSLRERGGIIYYKEDGLKTVFQDNEFDWIINATCVYNQNEGGYIDMLNANLIYPLEVLNYAALKNNARFITIGTGLPENFNMYSYTKHCLSDFGKRFSEEVTMLFCEMRAQLFYGCEEPSNRFMQMCVTKLLQGEDLQLTAGRQKRDIIRVEDLIYAIECVMRALKDTKAGYYIYETGTGESVSIREIVTYMAESIQSESKLNFGTVPYRENEPDCEADITALKEIGFVPQYTWKKGIEKLIKEKMGDQN